MIRISAIQMTSTSSPSRNKLLSKLLIEYCALNNSKIVFFPEATDFIRPFSDKISDEGKTDDFLQEIQNVSSESNIFTFLGVHRPSNEVKKFFNSYVFLPPGKNVQREVFYDKINLFDFKTFKESNSTAAGDKIVNVEACGLNIGMSICFDIRFPYIYSELRKNGANVLAIPSAFTVETGISFSS
jgi:predicted amidohydrolase